LVLVAALRESGCELFPLRVYITFLLNCCDGSFKEHFVGAGGDDDAAVEHTIAQQVDVLIEAQPWLNPYTSDCTHFLGLDVQFPVKK
jgi:hypothetical protein